MRAEVLSIGTELLLGQIVDTNAAYLAGRLALLGIDCLHMQTAGDNLARATEAFRLALSRSDLVVVTGGLGPTEDDLTREAIAAALGETPAVDRADGSDVREERRRPRSDRGQGRERGRRRRAHRTHGGRGPRAPGRARLGHGRRHARRGRRPRAAGARLAARGGGRAHRRGP